MKKIALLTVIAMGVPSAAMGADYPHRTELNSRSKSNGVARNDLTLLQRQAGPGAATVGPQLVARWMSGSGPITTAGAYTPREHSGHLRYVGESGWTLTVHADGTSVHYRNRAYRAAHLTSVPLSARPALSDLAAWGRDFIRSNLAGIISLGPGEDLVELRAEFEQQGSQSADASRPANRSVVGAAVVFSRTVDGVAVIGNGSKVAVFFGTDGTPWGFSYDWAPYSATSKRQRTLPVSEIRARNRVFTAGASENPDGTERYFECGYYDPGARRRDPNAPIQAGCISQRVVRAVGDAKRNSVDPNDGLFVSATVEVIPAGATVALDTVWPQAYYLATGRRLKNAPTPSDGPGPNTK